LRSFYRRRDQRGRDAPPAIAFAHVEAGERPDGHIIHTLEPPRAIKPRYGIARRQLTPAYGHVAVEGEQARRRTALHDLSKRRPVFLVLSLAIGSADPPIHAPAAPDGAIFAEQVLERGPQIGSEWADREHHAAVALIMFCFAPLSGHGRPLLVTYAS